MSRFEPKERDEKPHEFHRRVQDSIDRDSWVGRDETGQEFPKGPGVVRDMTIHEERPTIYKWEK